jgi:hypothetical protein
MNFSQDLHVVIFPVVKITVITVETVSMENAFANPAGQDRIAHFKYVKTIAIITVSARIGDVNVNQAGKVQTAQLKLVKKVV